jgi:hypothetical protein
VRCATTWLDRAEQRLHQLNPQADADERLLTTHRDELLDRAIQIESAERSLAGLYSDFAKTDTELSEAAQYNTKRQALVNRLNLLRTSGEQSDAHPSPIRLENELAPQELALMLGPRTAPGQMRSSLYAAPPSSVPFPSAATSTCSSQMKAPACSPTTRPTAP